MKTGGDRFTTAHINPVAMCNLQHGVWAASQFWPMANLGRSWPMANFGRFWSIADPLTSGKIGIVYKATDMKGNKAAAKRISIKNEHQMSKITTLSKLEKLI